jgi:hypothetical protein
MFYVLNCFVNARRENKRHNINFLTNMLKLTIKFSVLIKIITKEFETFNEESAKSIHLRLGES